MVLYAIIFLLIAAQLVFTWQVVNNYRNAKKKLGKQLKPYQPKSVVIIPCKGIDQAFDKNIASFFNQEYDNYRLWFVVQSDDDPARPQLERIISENVELSGKLDVRILTAGLADMCSQKLHNLVYAFKQIEDDSEVLVFADSDACAGPQWLTNLVNPLRDEKHGAASGYRWFIPGKNNPATIALSAINSKICQMMGNTRFNLAWGGSMAVKVETFKRLKVDELWSRSLSDDLALSRAIKSNGQKMVYLPACMAEPVRMRKTPVRYHPRLCVYHVAVWSVQCGFCGAWLVGWIRAGSVGNRNRSG